MSSRMRRSLRARGRRRRDDPRRVPDDPCRPCPDRRRRASMPHALATQRWRLAELPADVRVDAFRAAVSETHLPWSVAPAREGPPEQPGDGLTRYRLGDLALVDCRCGPCAGSRGRAQFAATDEDAVGVLF